MRGNAFAFVSLTFLASAIASAAEQSEKKVSREKHGTSRELQRRSIAITDDTATALQEVHIAGRIPTTLAFQEAIKPESILISDSTGALPERVRATDKVIVLLPNSDLPSGKVATLTVAFADGNLLSFILRSVPKVADLQIDVSLRLEKAAAPESAPALKAVIGQLRGQLDECQATAGGAGLSKLAALILAQAIDKPQVFERRNVHKADKQSRLLVQLRYAYRLFGYTYLVLTVENRDPSRTWVLDHPEIGVAGDSQSADVKIETFRTEVEALAPDEMERVVVAFSTPPQSVNAKLTLSLFEKNGNRHVKLEGLSL